MGGYLGMESKSYVRAWHGRADVEGRLEHGALIVWVATVRGLTSHVHRGSLAG